MVQVVALRLLKPLDRYAKEVAAKPYDVVNYEEGRAIAAANPLSFLRVEKSEIDLSAEIAADSDAALDQGRQNLERLIKEGIFRRDEKPCFYVYRQRLGTHEQFGLVAGIHVNDYESGYLKKHEFTRGDKELERTKHIARVNAQTGPVFVIYRSSSVINGIVARTVVSEPLYAFTADDGVSHTAWRIDRKDAIASLVKEFASAGSAYIADGHHRAAAATAVARMKRDANREHRGDEAYNYILSVLFPQDQLKIMDYNRVVKDLNGLTESAFMQRLSLGFTVEKGFAEKSPTVRHTFGMYLNGNWYRLALKDGGAGSRDAVASLDVSILQDLILEPILGIHDPRTDRRIDFVGGIRGMNELERLVDSGGYTVAFSLCPTTLDELMTVADAGAVMPPKSTWFEPKLRSGLFVHLLD
jgi:uncharacterized protein (DUF1015 family)